MSLPMHPTFAYAVPLLQTRHSDDFWHASAFGSFKRPPEHELEQFTMPGSM